MLNVIKCLILVQAFICGQQNVFTSAFQVELSPSVVDDMIPTDVELSCKFDSSDFNMQDIIIMELLKTDGSPIVILRKTSDAPIIKRNKSKYPFADGLISKNVTESFLSVTLKNPKKEDAGSYTCVIYDFNEVLGGLQEVRKSTTLEVNDMDVSKVLTHLLEKDALLESELEKCKNDSRAEDNRLEHLITAYQENESKMKEQISVLEKKLAKKEKIISDIMKVIPHLGQELKVVKDEGTSLKQQDVKLQALVIQLEKKFIGHVEHLLSEIAQQEEMLTQYIKKQNYTEAFTVGYSKREFLKAGDVMIFNDVIVDDGPGYDPVTGIFTARRPGFYLFNFFVSVEKKVYIDIEIQANNVAVSKILVGDSSSSSESSASCVTRLEAGDQVKVVVVSAIDLPLDPVGHHRSTEWSGFLLKAL